MASEIFVLSDLFDKAFSDKQPAAKRQEDSFYRNQNKNTKKSTMKRLNKFNKWHLARKEQRALEDIPVGELDAVLSKFFAEVRKIEITSLTGLRAYPTWK